MWACVCKKKRRESPFLSSDLMMWANQSEDCLIVSQDHSLGVGQTINATTTLLSFGTSTNGVLPGLLIFAPVWTYERIRPQSKFFFGTHFSYRGNGGAGGAVGAVSLLPAEEPRNILCCVFVLAVCCWTWSPHTTIHFHYYWGFAFVLFIYLLID